MSTVIRAEQITKRYRLGGGGNRAARIIRRLTRSAAEPSHHDALMNVSFDVARGDVFGVIGGNGAGKSTLLKILSRITAPTSGRFGIAGRVASLLEVGTGFHPELSGRENIFLSGSILGMSRGDVRRRFDEIASFSGVEAFLDTPVKRYSSGMRVRLGFAVAAHLEPEILMIDEVLAVGDRNFQARCLGKMNDFASGGRTVMFVSHQLASVERLCNRGVYLDGGRVATIGDIGDCLRDYQSRCDALSRVPIADRDDRRGDRRRIATRFAIADEPVNLNDASSDAQQTQQTQQTQHNMRCGDAVHFGIRLSMPVDGPAGHPVGGPIRVAILIRDSRDHPVATLFNDFVGRHAASSDRQCDHRESKDLQSHDEIDVLCAAEHLPITVGEYRIALWIAHGDELSDQIDDVGRLTIREHPDRDVEAYPTIAKHGAVMADHTFSFRPVRR